MFGSANQLTGASDRAFDICVKRHAPRRSTATASGRTSRLPADDRANELSSPPAMPSSESSTAAALAEFKAAVKVVVDLGTAEYCQTIEIEAKRQSVTVRVGLRV